MPIISKERYGLAGLVLSTGGCGAVDGMVTSLVPPRRGSIAEALFQGVSTKKQTKKLLRSLLTSSFSSYGREEDEDENVEMEQLGAERTKNVLILMSDTGGGHRASAEAIRDAFRLEFGDEYRVIRWKRLKLCG